MQRSVPHTVPRVGRSYEHFPDGFKLHLLPDTVNLSLSRLELRGTKLDEPGTILTPQVQDDTVNSSAVLLYYYAPHILQDRAGRHGKLFCCIALLLCATHSAGPCRTIR